MKENQIYNAGTKVYQYSDGTYLPEGSQPNPSVQTEYTPHVSTRYINVKVGKDGKALQLGRENKLVPAKGELPELYRKREQCCGCTACYAICPMSGESRPLSAQRTTSEGMKQHFEILISGNSNLKELREHTGAITMLPDEEGFLYPVVDAELCIRCYKCLGVCAFKADQEAEGYL